MTQDEPQAKRAWTWMLIPVLLFLGLHLRALDYEFVWTDQAEIEQGMLIRPPGSILAAFGEPMYRTLEEIAPGAAQPYYRPLQVVTVSLVDHYVGREPRGFRAVMLAIGAATMALFFFVVLPLLGDPRAAALAASIVAAHPAGIEDYVWIAGFSAAYATLFICASLAIVPSLMRAKTRARRISLTGLASLGLVGALLSKEGAVVLPALTLALLVSLVVREHARSPGKSLLVQLAEQRAALTLVGIQGALVVLYALALRPAVLGGTLAGTPPIHGHWPIHLMTALATWPDRLAWIFAPLQSTTSDVVPLAGAASPMAWLGILLGLTAPLVWYGFLRSGRAVAAFGWAWLWIAFLPTSGLAPLTHLVAVRYLSLSVFGASLLWLFLFERLENTRSRQWVATAAAIALVLVLSQRTWARTPDWRTDITLFEQAVARDPLYREGHYVLAVALAEQRQFEAARSRLDQLRIANGRFGARYSFSRDQDVALLLCKINLEIDQPQDSLHVLQRELRPDSALLQVAPELFRCGAESLRRVGREAEARELFEALDPARR